MNKYKVSRAKKKTQSKEWPLVVYVWIIGLAFLGYVVARIALDGYPHPLHWASGVAGGLVGILIGWAWYRWRGDILW